MTKTTKITDLSEILTKDDHLNATTAPYSHDLHQDGAKVHDGEKEAVNEKEKLLWASAYIEQFDGLDYAKDYLKKLEDLPHDQWAEDPNPLRDAISIYEASQQQKAVKSSRGAFNIWRKSKVDGYDAWDAWQHQQAVVDEYKMVAGALEDQLEREVKNNLELHRKLELANGWEKIAQKNGEDKRRLLSEKEELQKRVEALMTALNELEGFLCRASANQHEAFKTYAESYFDGAADALDAAMQKFQRVKKDLGGSHEPN